MRPLRLRFPFGRDSQREHNVDAPEHQHLVLHFNLATRDRRQPPLARDDPARLQRAPKGAEQSTGGGRHEIVDRGGVRIGDLALNAIVPGDGAVRPKRDRCGFNRQVCQPQWTSHPLEAYL